MRRVELTCYVEDPPSANIAVKLVEHANKSAFVNLAFRDGFPSNERGFSNIKKKMPAIVKAAEYGLHYFVIADLDRGACAPALVRGWLGMGAEDEIALPRALVFRVAVREIEAWILADRESLSKYLGIPIDNFPLEPDAVDDPKQNLLNILRRKGTKRWHKAMLPTARPASIGPLYNEKLCDFVQSHWDPARAKQRSPSLASAIQALARWA